MRPPAICATGWTENGFEGWKQSWGPIDPRTGKQDGAVEKAPAAVRGVITSLTGTFGNDVLHASGKKRAVNAFEAPQMGGVDVDPVRVRSLTLTAGWQSDATERLTDTSTRVGDGRTVRGGDALTRRSAQAMVERYESLADHEDS